MKLNYRDKVILAIVLAAAIIIAGFFALIKPKREDIKNNEKKLTEVQAEETKVRKRIALIETLQDEIDKTHSEADKLTKLFVTKSDIDKTTYLDQFMHEYADKSHVRVTELKTDDTASGALTYYYEPYTEVATALRESADINGTLQEKVDKESEEATLIAGRNVETVMSTRYGLNVRGKVKDVYEYMDQIKSINSAIIITTLGMTNVKEEEEEKTPASSDPDAKKPEESTDDDPEAKEWEDDTLVDASIVIQLYSVYNMDKPDYDSDAAAATE
jgi:general secretion pathway, M protein